MTATLSLQPLDLSADAHHHLLADLWTRACGDDLAASPRLVRYNTLPARGGLTAGVIARRADQAVGFVLVTLLRDDPSVQLPTLGRIDALAVAPEAQRQGIGSALLTWAEGFLLGHGCRQIRVGGGLRPFVPGVPAELESAGFFARHGYTSPDLDGGPNAGVWDVVADLSGYTPPPSVREIAGQAQPARPADEPALLAFLQREFPGRWRYEFQEHLREGGRISDYMVLWTDRGIDGCCILTFEDSARPIERFYPYRLPRPWGQLGSIGISADCRGRGYGAALLDAGLRRLHNTGVNGCVIDWTDLLDFYAKFGFRPDRRYLRLSKSF